MTLPFTCDTPATPTGAKGCQCRRHAWGLGWDKPNDPTQREIEVCIRCGKVRDSARSRGGKSARRLGGDQERRAEKVYGWRKVGEYGDIVDLRGTLMKVQQKASRCAAAVRDLLSKPVKGKRNPMPSPGCLAAWHDIFTRLDGVRDDRAPAILLSLVQQGFPTEDYIILRGREWLALHGKDEPA